MIPQHDKQGNRVQLLYYSSTAHYCLSFRRSLVTDRQGGIHLRVNHCRYFVPRRGGGKLSMTSSRTGVQLLFYRPTAHYCLSFRCSLATSRQGGIHFRSNHFTTVIIHNSDTSFPRRRRQTQYAKQRVLCSALYYSSILHYCLSFRRSLANSRQGGIRLRSGHFTTVIIYNSDASLPPMTGRFHTSF